MTVEEKKEETKQTESAVDNAEREEPKNKKNVGEQFSACIVVTLIALVTIVGLSVALAFRIRAIERCVAQLYPPVPGSDVVVFWYKPHYQCGAEEGSTPDQAASFINDQLQADVATDFVAISEWAPQNGNTANESAPVIGNPELYGSIASVCGYGNTWYTTPIELFHNLEKWDRVDSYPSSGNCSDNIPLPPWENEYGSVCINKTVPGDSDCCSCVYSEDEYDQADAWGQNLGQRPWVAGIYNGKSGSDREGTTVCVVAGEFPHPLWNLTLSTLNGAPVESKMSETTNQTVWTVNGVGEITQEPYSLQKYACTTQYQSDGCIQTPNKTSILYGSDVITQGVADFCQDLPIILMGDFNTGMGDFASDRLFLIEPLSNATSGIDIGDNYGQSSSSLPYTCCNDTSWGGGYNRYSSDRVLVVGETIAIDQVEGGSLAPGGPLPEEMTYQCHANEEHAPLRAYISL